MDIKYRQGREEDCPKLGRFCSMASDGILEFLLDGLVPGMSAAEVVAHDLAQDKEPRTFRNAMVAELAGEAKGGVFSYHSRFHGVSDDMRRFIPAERLEAMRDFYQTRVEDSLYIDSLAVDADLRGRGVGGRLLGMTREKALALGLGSLSLFVALDNHGALGLYQRNGFKEVRRVTIDWPDGKDHGGDLLLMERKIARP